MSLASEHFQRVAAQEQANKAAKPDVHASSRTEYEKMLLKLDSDKANLSRIQSTTAKIELKKKIINEYKPYLDGVLSADKSPQDNVIVTLMMWYFDIGEIARALALAEFALKNNMAMPENFKRTLGCVVAEQSADQYLAGCYGEISEDEKIELLLKAQTLTAKEDMPDEVNAKLHKALGFAYRNNEDLPNAKTSLEKALAFNNNCGVKTDLEKIKKELKKASDPAS